MPLAILSNDALLKETFSRCPRCLRRCPAEVWRRGAEPGFVEMVRHCAEHGSIVSCIASDARFYWTAGTAKECCGGEANIARSAGVEGNTGTLGKNACCSSSSFQELSTCIALIEIVNSCNLSCPVCYANSPHDSAGGVDSVALDDIKERIGGVIIAKGKIEILQLSGGEPTLHARFFELLDWLQKHAQIDYILLNTNGVRLAGDNCFRDAFARAVNPDKVQLYLQFDGVQEQGQRKLRGVDLRAVREKAIDFCSGLDVPITLAMTVTPDNLPSLGSSVSFGLERPHIHGITFQPMFGSGRVLGHAKQMRASARITVADIVLALIAQSNGLLGVQDFTPLPCGDPNCATIGYLLRTPQGLQAISKFFDFGKLQGFLHDTVHHTVKDLSRCGCESEPLGHLLKSLELQGSVAFRIFIKPFMDAYTWDEDRIARCCTHVIKPDGKLDSFCRYYSGFSA